MSCDLKYLFAFFLSYIKVQVLIVDSGQKKTNLYSVKLSELNTIFYLSSINTLQFRKKLNFE